MELNKQKNKDPKDCLTIKKLPDFTDVTIYGTPLPQATSTVDRKSLIQGKSRRSNLDDQNNKYRQLNFDITNSSQNGDESSLGIIQNVSSLNTSLEDYSFEKLKNEDPLERQRELARQVLQKCSEPLIASLSNTDKENNANCTNLQNKSNTYKRSFNKTLPSKSTNQAQNPRQSFNCDNKSTHTNSIIFEPREISARSSELNKTPEKSEPFPGQNFSGISYNSNLAEMMAQFGDEEFMSGSKAGSQIMADEMSWRKNKFTSMPLSDKDRLELSCFSGIIGDVDLTVDGGRMSVGEFFRRKCGGTGHLSTASVSDRPSLGLNSKSPQRKGKLRALVDETVSSEASYCPDRKESKSADCTKDPSVMSLSSIAQLLQDTPDTATPRKLVDQILDAQKKKRKQKVENNNVGGDTYTLLQSNRISLPVSKTFLKDKPEENMTFNSFLNKLSLDSKSINELSYRKNTNQLIKNANSIDPKMQKLLEINSNYLMPETSQKFDQSSTYQKSPNRSVPRAEKFFVTPTRQLSNIPNTTNKFINSNSANNESSLIHDDIESSDVNEKTLTKNDESKEDTLTNLLMKSFDTRKVEIGKKTQELCTCLVGIPKEEDFEIYNGTDRWVLCSIKLHQIQGDKDNIELSLPDDNILIEPDIKLSFKVGVKMPRMGKLTIAVLHIPCSDMVTKTSWYMKHIMCFVPEESNIKISVPSESDVNFPMITEDTNSSLPITIENNNSIDVPIILRLNQEMPKLFSIGDCLDDTVSTIGNQKESVVIALKPKQPVTVNFDFKGMSLHSFGDSVLRKGLYNTEAELNISICFKENEEYPIRKISFKGTIGCCKLDVIDTQFPMSLQPKTDRLISLKNSGSITVSATVDIVQSKVNLTECRDFFICPNNILLNGGERLALQISYKPESYKADIERQAMVRISVGNKVSFYPIIGEKGYENEQFSSDSFHQLQRCDTPQRLRVTSSPTSPHSLVFNRSGTSGRHSPGSTVSGGTTAGGVIVPIRATHTALVWGSVKTGKSDTKQLTIRNTSNNKIKLYAKIRAEEQNFKFLKDRQTLVSSMTLSLQGMESKTFSVVFAPNYPRAAAGKIIFSHYSSIQENRDLSGLVKVIQLFGYGGFGKIEISEAVKDTSGQMWLSLGKLTSEGVLRSKIRLHNTGDLTCFSKVKLIPKAFYPSVVTSWHVDPTEFLIGPNQIQWITIEFRPKKDDLASAHQIGVIQVGTLKITHGDEPTRLRIRRLYKKLKDSGQLHDKVDQQGDEFKEVIYPLSKAFPGEAFTQDLKLIGDSVQNLGDLCKGITQNEIKLTVELHADETLSMLQDNMDDSQAFYSLCSDHGNESHFGESFLPLNET